MNVEEIRDHLNSDTDASLRRHAFDILRNLAALSADEVPGTESQDLVIRCLDRAEAFDALRPLLYALVRQHGLFPYLNPEELDFADLVVYECNRPDRYTDERFVFHRAQNEIYRKLLKGESIVLSAPTSFGKSLILDALLASGNYANVAIIVPTIALIDETRRRLARFRDFKLVTHPSQSLALKNILVMTQERLLATPALPPLDLFMIDEFYKLHLETEHERAVLLNQAFHKLYKTNAQFYLAGPSVEGLAASLPDSFDVSFVHTDYATVAVDLIRLDAHTPDEKSTAVTQICNGANGPTLVYCSSPDRVRQVGRWLLERSRARQLSADLAGAADWVASTFHPSWLVARALRDGVGLHHGRLPRALAQEIVHLFNDGQLDTLVCTSTLIEGVNTRAKNVIILDNRVARRQHDYFTFNNIKGRPGRMFQYFVGRVYLFHDPPQPILPIVDIPILSQSSAASDALLLQLDLAELSVDSWQKIRKYYEQNFLNIDTIRSITGIEPGDQVRLAEHLSNNPQKAQVLAWRSSHPRFNQLEETCQTMLDYIPPAHWQDHGAVSARQLAYLLIETARARGDPRALIEKFVSDDWAEGDSDAAVEAALDFIRFWPGHHIPVRFRAIQTIAAEVYSRLDLLEPDYSGFIARAESQFMEPFLADLEEYGLPIAIVKKLRSTIREYTDLDDLLSKVARARPRADLLTHFERNLLTRVQQSL
jgi:hypothetical protein